MLKTILALIVGLVAGMAANMALIKLSTVWYPMPEGLDPNDFEQFAAWIATLPPQAFVLPLLAHVAQAFVGCFVAAKLRPASATRLAWIISLLSMAGGLYYLLQLECPWWMWLEVPGYIVLGLLGASLARGRRLQ